MSDSLPTLGGGGQRRVKQGCTTCEPGSLGIDATTSYLGSGEPLANATGESCQRGGAADCGGSAVYLTSACLPADAAGESDLAEATQDCCAPSPTAEEWTLCQCPWSHEMSRICANMVRYVSKGPMVCADCFAASPANPWCACECGGCNGATTGDAASCVDTNARA